ncbi:MAG: gamma-glutamyl-gamma-aminobutyrate hydrolase family protein, partial [Hymenobacter sp.]|nr:gamma-glutamyl-gamma-aminobutyrate hydrolase family protein [Hymenobacter sp.]
VQVVRNDVPLAVLEEREFDALVLSPGPGTPAAAGNLLGVIAAWHQRVPILGVCLGHQARPMHGKVSEMTVAAAEPLFQGLPQPLAVTRYHSLVVNDLPPVLRPVAHTTDAAREIMALRHATLPLVGVQFHPEALLTTHGLTMLGNWVRYCIIVEEGPAANTTPATR